MTTHKKEDKLGLMLEREEIEGIMEVLYSDEDTQLAIKVRNGEDNLRRLSELQQQIKITDPHE